MSNTISGSEFKSKFGTWTSADKVIEVGKYVSDKEAVAWRAKVDSSFKAPSSALKTVIRADVVALLQDCGIVWTPSRCLHLINTAKYVPEGDSKSSFSILDYLRSLGYSYTIIDASSVEKPPKSKRVIDTFPTTGKVYRFERVYGSMGGETLYMPIENGMPNVNFVDIKGVTIVPYQKVIVAVAKTMAMFFSISAGKFEGVTIGDDAAAFFGFDLVMNRAHFMNMCQIVLDEDYLNAMQDFVGVTLHGKALAHEIYSRMLKVYMNNSALMTAILRLLNAAIAPVSGTHNFVSVKNKSLCINFYRPVLPKHVKGKMLGPRSATASQAWNSLTIARPIRGDNKTERGAMVADSYVESIAYSGEADACTLAYDIKGVCEGAPSLLLRLGDSKKAQTVALMLRALTINNWKGTIYYTVDIGSVLGLTPVAAKVDSTVRKYQLCRFGSTDIYTQFVSESIYLTKKCKLSDTVLSEKTVIIDLTKKTDDARSSLTGIAPSNGSGLAQAMEFLGATGQPWVTRTYMFEGILDRTHGVSVYPSCEYHNLGGWVTSIPMTDTLDLTGLEQYYYKAVICNYSRMMVFFSGYKPYKILHALGFAVPEINTAGIGNLGVIELTMDDMQLEALELEGGLLSYISGLAPEDAQALMSNPSIASRFSAQGDGGSTSSSAVLAGSSSKDKEPMNPLDGLDLLPSLTIEDDAK